MKFLVTLIAAASVALVARQAAAAAAYRIALGIAWRESTTGGSNERLTDPSAHGDADRGPVRGELARRR